MTPLQTIHHHLAINFLASLTHGLGGFAAAHARWRDDPCLRELTKAAVTLWKRRVETYQGLPKPDPQPMVEIQILNAAMTRSDLDPALWIQNLIHHGRPDFSIIRKKQRALLTEAEKAWENAGIVIGLLPVRELMSCWRTVTPRFLEAIANGLPGLELPTEAEMREPDGIARFAANCESALKDLFVGEFAFDPQRDPPRFENPAIPATLRALASLSDQEAAEYADMLLDQQESWTLGDVQRTKRFKFWIGSRLAELAAFHQPLAKHRRERAEALDADYPGAVELEPGEDLSCKGAWVELGKEQSTSYLPSGYVLEELPDGSPIPSPVAAGLLALQQMGIRGPLLVVLDIDLTHPDMAFLGLSGNRLRICDQAEPPDDDGPLFTKVTLDGDVHPLKLFDRYPQPKVDGYRLRRFGIGRALLSPFEGLRAAASLGARCKIGGAPDWEQYPADPISPKSGKFMTFIAQFDHPLGGTAYAFLDTENLIATVITQND